MSFFHWKGINWCTKALSDAFCMLTSALISCKDITKTLSIVTMHHFWSIIDKTCTKRSNKPLMHAFDLQKSFLCLANSHSPMMWRGCVLLSTCIAYLPNVTPEGVFETINPPVVPERRPHSWLSIIHKCFLANYGATKHQTLWKSNSERFHIITPSHTSNGKC